MITPKFDPESISHDILKEVIEPILKDKLEALAINGVKNIKYKENTWNRDLSYDIDTDNLSAKTIKQCNRLFTIRMEAKNKVVVDLLAKCDAVLFDVKSYPKFKEALFEMDLCKAETEMDDLLKRYIRGTAPSKAIYRARLQKFYKIQCT